MGYVKLIAWFDEYAAVACDGNCGKAWGRNTRAQDGGYYFADHQLGDAPEDPGTSEGSDSKPLPNEPKLNRWCVRECERSELYGSIEREAEEAAEKLPDFSKRVKV